MLTTVLLIVGCLVCVIMMTDQDKKKTPAIQANTALEVKKWTSQTKRDIDEIVRKTKDMEVQQPLVQRPVLKMTEKDLEAIQGAFPGDLPKEQKQEYLVLTTDPSGKELINISYEHIVGVIPMDRYIV